MEQGRSEVIKPSGIIYKLNMPLIKNDTVGAIQKSLITNGINLTVDNVYGQKTSDAVKVFQKKMGLNPDGVVGEKTAKLLNVKI